MKGNKERRLRVDLVRIDEIMNTEKYCQILIHSLESV